MQPAATSSGQAASQGDAQASTESVKVAVRLRPFTELERKRESRRIVDIEQNTIELVNPKLDDEQIKRFTFDHSYWSHDGFKRNAEGVNVPDNGHKNCSKYVGQEQVFEDLGRFLLENALQGYNSALLAYGQTGSGKSYTVSGYGKNEGILPRFARELFVELEARTRSSAAGQRAPAEGVEEAASQTSDAVDDFAQACAARSGESADQATGWALGNRFEIYFSMIEIYNEVVRDLLSKQSGAAQSVGGAGPDQRACSIARRGLRVREHPKRGFFVENLSSYLCSSKEEIESLIEEGQLNKSIVATSMNETSSRGHTIYEFHIRQFKSNGPLQALSTVGSSELETLTSSIVQLVDLAGSERLAVHVKPAPGGLGATLDISRPASRSSSPGPPTSARGTSSAMPSAGSPFPTTSSLRMGRSAAASGSASSSSSTATLNNLANNGQTGSLQRRGQASHFAASNANHRQRFKESVSINQSLSALGNCIQVLSQYSLQQPSGSAGGSSTKKIPYRDSVLTKLLNRCCLSGNSKVVLIATLSPADANYDDTLSTLRFADRAKQIKTHAVINRSSRRGESASGSNGYEAHQRAVSALKSENERLKQMLDGRVTRSDDSSQTSNFDDTENMLDNFNGPQVAAAGSARVAATASGESAQTDAASASSPGAINPRPSNKGASGLRGRPSEKQHRRLTTTKSSPRRTPASSTSSSRHQRSGTYLTKESAGGKDAGQQAATSLRASASNPSISASNESEQMRRLVSSAKKKMRQSTRNLTAADGAQVAGAIAARKPAGRPTMQLELLDDSDLNELANIIEDENLLSPGSEDSNGAANGRPRRPFDTNISKEEKISILNKLMSNSNVAELIGRQISGAVPSSPLRSPSGRSGPKLARPKKAAAAVATAKAQARSSLATNTNSLKRTNPYLSNLNADEQLTGMISHIIKPGETIVGKNADCDLLVYGPGVRGRHAKLTRASSSSSLTSGNKMSTSASEQAVGERVFVEPILADDSNELPPNGPGQLEEDAKRVALMLNGEPVLRRTKLSHCDRLLFGSTGYFLFVDNEVSESESEKVHQITYELAHGEVLRKVMSDETTEATIKEISEYTHRPGTGKQRAVAVSATATAAPPTPSDPNAELSRAALPPITPHENGTAESPIGAVAGEDQVNLEAGPAGGELDSDSSTRKPPPLDKIGEEEADVERRANASELDELYRGKLMADTYEFALPIAEANAIAKEMGIKVTYSLKILTGEEQLLYNNSDDEFEDSDVELAEVGSNGFNATTGGAPPSLAAGQQRANQASGTNANEFSDYYATGVATIGSGHSPQPSNANDPTSEPPKSTVWLSTCDPIQPETLDIPPELYVRVHLDELNIDFYWSKEKFQERRIKMLELYGAWDVGGKSGLVEHLIEQSKYQGYFMIDPFVDDLATSWALIGHAQVTLQPLAHMSGLLDSFDVLDVDDEIVGRVQIEALPCKEGPAGEEPDANFQHQQQQQREQATNSSPNFSSATLSSPFKTFSKPELAASFLENPAGLLGKKFVFLFKINSFSEVPEKFAQLFCQYTLNRNQTIVRTKLVENFDRFKRGPLPVKEESNRAIEREEENRNSTNNKAEANPQSSARERVFNHKHYIVIDEMSQDILDFVQHGFLTIQLVGQYATAQSQLARKASSELVGWASKTPPVSAQASSAQPTLVSNIISSINKYRFRMEQQNQQQQVGEVEGASSGAIMMDNYLPTTGSAYANSLTDSGRSANYRITSGGIMSNSAASSVTSASANIVNLFDQQNDEDEGINSLNGNSQENIIDMILTKRKLDRAENQLHYIKRTINIAEHHNKKHIPVRTVKKVLNSYGQELEGGSLEEIAAEVTTEVKGGTSKHSNCIVQ